MVPFYRAANTTRCFDSFPYPVGTGKTAIQGTMLPKSRRVKWPARVAGTVYHSGFGDHMNFPPELMRSINSGRCFALTGSGPSTEMGYPSWAKLAETVAFAFMSDGTATDPDAYKACLEKKQYPELFQQAEFDGGGRRRLFQVLKAVLVPKQQGPGTTYEMLARWPFACYLTTNYDNEAQNHLERLNVHYTVLQNTLEDLQQIRDGATHLIVKLHSDLDHLNGAVITSSDYKRLSTDIAGAYFRTKLRAMFDMFDVVIIGHSFSDPDLRILLQTAQETANPNRPIYMITTGLSTIEIREFYQNFNIVVIPYQNPDGKHDQLRRLLSAADKFITPRTVRFDLPPPIDAQESEAAASMLIFRRLQAVKDQPNWRTAEYLGPLILQALTGDQSVATSDDLLGLKPFASMLSVSDRQALLDSINDARRDLASHGLLENALPLRLTNAGKELSLDLKSTRELEQTQAYGQFTTMLRRFFPGLDESQADRARTLVEQCVVDTFRKRGLAIANTVFGDQTAGPEDLSTLFAAISQTAAHLESPELQLAFTEAAHEFLAAPTAPQRGYLTSLSQGFFLYHMLGYDAGCTKVRQDLFRTTTWFCDSSVLIPMLAVGSQNHDYAVDLFLRLRKRDVRPFVTRRMCTEVWEHLQWAVRFVRENPSITPAFLAAALVKPGYKQNLFIDGFIRLSAEGRVSTFADYIEMVCGGSELSYAAILKTLAAGGIRVTDMSLAEGFRQEDWAEVQEVADIIKDDRAMHLIYRSDDQVYAEAEVLYIIRQLRGGGYRLGTGVERAYFISQSNVLNRVAGEAYVTTWTPEAVYRYLLSLPGELPDPLLLQECMLHEFYHAGVSVIDKERYLRFFGPAINTSRLRFEEQKQQYLKDVETSFGAAALEAQFKAVPDLEKPLFVHRITLRSVGVAQRMAQEAMQRAKEAERKVKQLEEERANKWRNSDRARARQVAAEERNRANPKHVRKRQRQRKRRAKKK